MTEQVSFTHLTREERVKLEKVVLSDRTGCGEIYRGESYHLDYQPITDRHNLVCHGVELLIRRNDNQNAHEFLSVNVYYKNGWFNKTPFTDRLKDAIERQKQAIINREKDHRRISVEMRKAELAKEELLIKHAKKIRACHLKMDATIKKIEPQAKALEIPFQNRDPNFLEPLSELERQQRINDAALNRQ